MTITEPVQLALVGAVSALVSIIATHFSTRYRVEARLDRIERIQAETMRLLLRLAEKEGISVNPLVMELMRLPAALSSATSGNLPDPRPVGFRTT